jgi:hypothetical protein
MSVEEMFESVMKAALENVRQTSSIPFWCGSHEVTPQEQLRRLFSETRANDRKVMQMLEKAAELSSRDSFEIQYRPESRNHNGNNISNTLWIILKDGYEWDDVIKDAWAGFESENPWFLTDNALKVLKWIKSPKNTGDFVLENRIGSQASLLGTGSYSRIGSYVKEICLKTPHHIKMEKTGGWHGSYKLTLMDKKKEDVAQTASDNPIFPYRMEKKEPNASQAYTRMIEDFVLKGDFDDDAECCILFEIHSRAELVRALPAVAADAKQTPYELKQFLGDLRLPRGLRPAATLDDEAGVGWLLGAGPEKGWTWERVKESIMEIRDRKDPCETYGLSRKAGKILNWIWSLHDNEIKMGMTPCVENAARDQIGIEKLDYDQNSKVILQFLIEEINEKTPYALRMIPWHEYPRGQHRILIRKKENQDDVIIRMIQIRGLEKNVALSASVVEKAIQDLWVKGIPLTEE